MVAVDIGGALLGLQLLTLLQLGIIAKVRRYSRVNMVLLGVVLLDEPGRTGPCLAHDRLLDKGPEHSLGEDAPVARNVILGDNGLVSAVMRVNEISRRWLGACAVGQYALAKGGFVADAAMGSLPAMAGDGDLLARVVVLLELVVDCVDEIIESGNDLKLDPAEDGALEGLGE